MANPTPTAKATFARKQNLNSRGLVNPPKSSIRCDGSGRGRHVGLVEVAIVEVEVKVARKQRSSSNEGLF